jgi:hypothetical protein
MRETAGSATAPVAGCKNPLDIQYELLGHETKTVASGYGRGSPVPLLRKWLDMVGF